ncbi:uncharacterized protein LY89DRAFT_690435, partial [Mollisia scopiformis]
MLDQEMQSMEATKINYRKSHERREKVCELMVFLRPFPPESLLDGPPPNVSEAQRQISLCHPS